MDQNQGNDAAGGSAGGSPAPGWYPDPSGSGGQRYWDGSTWTEQMSGGDPAGGPTGGAPAGGPGGGNPFGWFTSLPTARKAIMGVAAVSLAVSVFFLVTGGSGSGELEGALEGEWEGECKDAIERLAERTGEEPSGSELDDAVDECVEGVEEMQEQGMSDDQIKALLEVGAEYTE